MYNDVPHVASHRELCNNALMLVKPNMVECRQLK